MAKKILSTLILVLFYLGLVFLCGEIYARVKHNDTLAFKVTESEYRQADFELHHSFVPGSKGCSIAREWNVPYVINSDGLRDREYSKQPSPGSFRILVLGDSFTEGYGVTSEKSFSKILEEKLNNSGNGGYDVINAGVASYSPLLEYLYLVKKGLALNPSAVLLFYDFGDLKDDAEYEATTFFDSSGKPVKCVPYKRVRVLGKNRLEKFFIRHSRFYLYLENRINKVLFKTKMPESIKKFEKVPSTDRYIAFRENKDAVVDSLWKTNKNYLGLICDLLKEKGIKLILVSYPYAIEVSEGEWMSGRVLDGFDAERVYDQPKVAEYLKAFGEENNIVFINLYEDFRSYDGTLPLYYDFDGHFNANGHELVADALFRKLFRDGDGRVSD